MVPNHMGIDSRWISEQPDYFLSLDSPPFPSYSFSGPDLSSNPDHSIFLEDHYYDQSDAAVVFMRRDNLTGSTRYIYHGNDGTSMPWNDTAQLDYFNPEVREAITQTILDVARKFSVIRFDAAMTLSKKHYQRLWFPPPGTGGAIPTRSAFSLSKDEFDSRMPAEFWRELVDRVTEEVPDTLLLAEAFWMMEGYFVRTLGMHRVYNSAFMHMLRDEDNTKYRKLIIDTLEFDPQIMKRYVNFMNNPDEETALSQFGSGGKYFGTCLVMATLPGLPMFGHGQIEGLAEKYGMEYQKAYYNETPDPAFVDRHEREIFPLLHRRYLFSEVYNFYLFGLHRQDGTIDADVLSYSNRAYGENALIIFHNKWGDTRGWLSHSAPVNGKSTNLVTALGLSDNGDYITFTDRITGLEYIRSLKDLQSYGLFLELGAYQYHAFMDFKTVSDTDGSLTSLDQTLNGAGTLSLHNRKLEIKCSPLIDPIRQLLAEKSQIVLSTKNSDALSTDTKELISSTGDSFFSLLPTIFPEIKIDLENSFQRYTKRIHSVISLISDTQFSKLSPNASLLFSWSFLADLPGLIKEEALNIFLNLLIDRLAGSDQFPGPDRAFSFDELSLAFLLSSLLAEGSINPTLLGDLFFKEAMIRQYLNIHEHAGEEWFHKESMESMLKLAYTMVSIHHRIDFQLVDSHDNRDEEKAELDLITCFAESMAAIERSGYRVADFSALLRNLNCRKKA
jgi:hypothetical protein